MYARMRKIIEINDLKSPEHNEYIQEYSLGEEAKQILTAQLFNLALTFSLNHNVEPIKRFADDFYATIERKSKPTITQEVINDAKMLIEDYLIDEIIEAIIEEFDLDEIEFSDTLHEVITDQYYSRDEAIRVLDELYEYEETDAGLWEGQGWETILSTEAAYTYSNAVYDHVRNMIEEMEDIDINEIEDDMVKQEITKQVKKVIEEY